MFSVMAGQAKLENGNKKLDKILPETVLSLRLNIQINMSMPVIFSQR